MPANRRMQLAAPPPSAVAAAAAPAGSPVTYWSEPYMGGGLNADVGQMFDTSWSWVYTGTSGGPAAPTSGSITIQAGTQSVYNVPDNPSHPYNAGSFSFAGLVWYDSTTHTWTSFGLLTGKFPLCPKTAAAPTLHTYRCASMGPGTQYTMGTANTLDVVSSTAIMPGTWQPGTSAVTLGWAYSSTAQTLTFTVNGTTIGHYTGMALANCWGTGGARVESVAAPGAPYWPSTNYTLTSYTTSTGTKLMPFADNYFPTRWNWVSPSGGEINCAINFGTTLVTSAQEYTGFTASGLGSGYPVAQPSNGTNVFNTPVPGLASVTAVGSAWSTTGGMPNPPALSIACPPGVQNGDLLLLVRTGSPACQTAPDTTWIQCGSAGYYYSAYFKSADAEPAAYTLNNPNGFPSNCVILAYRNAQLNSFTNGDGLPFAPGTSAPPCVTPYLQFGSEDRTGILAVVAMQAQMYCNGWPATLQTISGPTNETGWNQRAACFNSVDATTAWGSNMGQIGTGGAWAITASDKYQPSASTENYLLSEQLYFPSTPAGINAGVPAIDSQGLCFAEFSVGPKTAPPPVAPGTFRASATINSGQALISTFSLPAFWWIQPGDLMLLAVNACYPFGSTYPPAGWAQVSPPTGPSGLYWKIATAADAYGSVTAQLNAPVGAMSLSVYGGPCYPAVIGFAQNVTTPGISFSTSLPSGVIPADTLLYFGAAQNTENAAAGNVEWEWYTTSSENLNMPYTAPWTARNAPDGPLTVLGTTGGFDYYPTVCMGMSEAPGTVTSLPALTSSEDSYFYAGVVAVRAGTPSGAPPVVQQTYTVGGTVSGLSGGTVVLQDSTGAQLTISANGAFTFPAELAAGAAYGVSVAVSPAGQVATVTGGSGTIGSANVTSVSVICAAAATYTVGGTCTGLTGTLVLQDNSAGDLTVTSNGTFTFPTSVPSGSGYSVTVLTAPTGQTAAVTNASGIVTNANVTSIAVTCTTTTGGTAYTVGGTVSGLTGTLTLADGDGNQVTVTANGAFNFPAVATGTAYNVTAVTAPAGQTVTVTGATGTMGGANVTTVLVTCAAAPAFTVGGTITGLEPGGTILLQDNGGDGLAVSGNGPFTFATPIPAGGGYNVTILTSPVGQAATVSNGAGTVGSANVTSVTVICAPAGTSPSAGVPGAFTIGGELILGGGTTTAANAPVLTPTLTAGTAAQLADTSRDYTVYLQTSASGTFSLAIGPTSTPASVVFASASLASAELVSFRCPAGWFILWAGTATLTQQRAIGC